MRIEREIVVPESPEELWETLTEPERLEEWFANDVELDARPGGTGVFRWDDGEERRAVVREAAESERLVLDWDDGGEVVIGDGAPGPVGLRLRAMLTDIQRGTAPDTHSWMRTLVPA